MPSEQPYYPDENSIPYDPNAILFDFGESAPLEKMINSGGAADKYKDAVRNVLKPTLNPAGERVTPDRPGETEEVQFNRAFQLKAEQLWELAAESPAQFLSIASILNSRARNMLLAIAVGTPLSSLKSAIDNGDTAKIPQIEAALQRKRLRYTPAVDFLPILDRFVNQARAKYGTSQDVKVMHALAELGDLVSKVATEKASIGEQIRDIESGLEELKKK